MCMIPPNLAEIAYPISFRKTDATTLGEHLRLRQSVELIGMKRVGISNFLRFFLYHQDIVSTYISKDEHHIFIPVDLNDLVERELKPFWILTLKRIADATEESTVSTETKHKISALFLQSIQLQNNFLTIENIKKAVLLLISENMVPTLFFLRFDRMRETVTHESFTNIQGLIESTNRQLACVFTSERPLDQIRPDVFTREELTTFSHLMYLKPARVADSYIMHSTILDRYNITQPEKIKQAVISCTGGHMQYIYLANIILYEKFNGKPDPKFIKNELLDLLLKDERIKLQSEEIYESFTKNEQNTIRKIAQQKITIIPDDSNYLRDTGVVEKTKIFSPLFEAYLLQNKHTSPETVEFSKKEHKLYTLLLENINNICERDTIISAVWPESEEIGVSDWTIDRLIARLRHKLSVQKSNYSIITVKTRGYKLVQS